MIIIHPKQIGNIPHGFDFINPEYKEIFGSEDHIDMTNLTDRRISFLIKKVKEHKEDYDCYREYLPENLSFEQYLGLNYILKETYLPMGKVKADKEEKKRISSIKESHMKLETFRTSLLQKGISEDFLIEEINEVMQKSAVGIADLLSSTTNIPTSELQASAFEYLSMTSGCFDGVEEFCIASPAKKEEMRTKYFNLQPNKNNCTEESNFKK